MTIPPNPHPEQVEARELLAQKLEAFGYAGRAGCIRMGENTDVPSHIALELAFASLANRPADDGEQSKRRAALVERIGTVADLACESPLQGDLGDVAYDLLRQAAAQIASDGQRLVPQPEGAKRP